jgi:hypothetical protein
MGQHVSDVITSSVTGVRYGYSGSSSGTVAAPNPAGRVPLLHEPSSASGCSQQHAHMQHLVPAAAAAGRGALVLWLRCVLDLLAALTLADPAAVLNELSHKLAGGVAASRRHVYKALLL